MAEDKRSNPFPFPIASEVEAMPGDRETKAARNIMARRVRGIPCRPYLLGDCDHAPVLQGVRDLTAVCYQLLDALDAADDPQRVGAQLLPSELAEPRSALLAILMDHGCPETREEPKELQPE